MKSALVVTNGFAIIAVTMSLAGSVCDCGNLAELLASTRLALIIALVASVVIAWMVKARKTLVSMTALTILSCASIALLFPSRSTGTSDGTKIRVLEMNLWGGRNRSNDAVIDEIKLQKADLVCISEITNSWLSTLKTYLPEYPYVVAEPTYGGVAFFSRLPIKKSTIEFCSEAKRSRIDALVSKDDHLLRIICVHPQIPVKTQEMRDTELKIIASEIQHSKEPVILVGDLNLTPFSYHFHKLMSDANLVDSEQGFGILPTWNCFFPITLVPIDHCLTSPVFATTARQLGHRIGSDHIPLVVDLSLF